MIATDYSDRARPGAAPMVFGSAPLPLRPGWHYVRSDGVALCFRHIESGVPVWTWWLASGDYCRWSVLVPRMQTVEQARTIARDFGFGLESDHVIDRDGDHRVSTTAIRWASAWTPGGAA